MKIKCRNLIAISVLGLLSGCAATSPAPVSGLDKDYSRIARGSYRGSYYEVKRGDTLYYIAYITDKNVNDIVRFNNLKKPYTIFPGQKLKLWQPVYHPPSHAGSGAGAVVSSIAKTGAASTTVKTTSVPVQSKNSSSAKVQNGSKNSQNSVKKDPKKGVDQSKTKEYVGSVSKQNVNKNVSNPKPQETKVSEWLWPTKGRVVKNFSAGDQGNKGIDIAGQRGQPISSTAAGTVVYSGNALRGYGNLVIIKHNEHYLSAYAHNDRLLVKEGQSVKAGQKIATMGSSGTSSVRLHFEIRYQGKSVNPKRYLP